MSSAQLKAASPHRSASLCPGQLTAQSLLRLPVGAIKKNSGNNCYEQNREWLKIYCCSFPGCKGQPVQWGVRHEQNVPRKSHLSASSVSWDTAPGHSKHSKADCNYFQFFTKDKQKHIKTLQGEQAGFKNSSSFFVRTIKILKRHWCYFPFSLQSIFFRSKTEKGWTWWKIWSKGKNITSSLKILEISFNKLYNKDLQFFHFSLIEMHFKN